MPARAANDARQRSGALRRVLARWSAFRAARRIQSPLANQLIRLIFGLYFAFAFVITLVQLGVEYREERDDLRQEATEMVQLVRPALSQAVWDFDRDSVRVIARALEGNQAIAGLRIEGTGHETLVRGQTRAQDAASRDRPHTEPPSALTTLYEQTYPLEYAEYAGEAERMGTLTVYSSSAAVFQRSQQILYTIVAGALLKTLALGLILYWVVKFVVGLPLSGLSERINRFNREMVAAGGSDGDATTHRATRNELRFLVRSFAAMRRALRRSRQELLSYQRSLEDKVEQRTAELRYQAEHDPLTGLLNRRALQARVAALPRELGRREGPENTLVYVDLDDFKLVNDTFGHQAGDRLLQRIAEILERGTRTNDIVARLGGDEFALVLKDCAPGDAETTVDEIGERIEAASIEEFGPRGRITISAGIVELEPAGAIDRFSHALSSADTAAYTAKHTGGNRIELFTSELVPASRRYDESWVTVINRALREEGLALDYAPYRDHAGRIRGVRIDPLLVTAEDRFAADRFLPTAERYRLARPIDLWTLERTLAHLSAHPRLAERLAFVQVVVTADTAGRSQAHNRVRELLQRYPLNGLQLYLSVTDDIKFTDLSALGRALQDLQAIGIGFAVHDFARLHSPFAHLSRLPVALAQPADEFVPGVNDNAPDETVLHSLVAFCRSMDVRTALGGATDAATVERLFAAGADYVGGPAIGPSETIDHLDIDRLDTLERGGDAPGEPEN